MMAFDFTQATISYHLIDPHSKSLEPDCLSHISSDCNTAFYGEGDLLFISFFKHIIIVLDNLSLFEHGLKYFQKF